MKAIHVNSTAPSQTYYGRAGQYGFELKDFELLSTILSALEWRRHNGSIKMYTDNVAADYYEKCGLSGLWDDGIDTDTLENCGLRTSYNVFWASARTVALGAATCPFVMLDTDLIVWRNIAGLIRSPFMAIHSEPMEFEVYVDKERLHTPPGYVWDDWDWTASPLNAALMYFGRDDLRDLCAKKGLEYLQDNFLEKESRWPVHAVFVEQRLYSLCARKLGVPLEFFLGDYHGTHLADGAENDVFTHLWVYKSKLMKNPGERRRICIRMVQRILKDFPEFGDTLAAIPALEPYLDPLPADAVFAAPLSSV